MFKAKGGNIIDLSKLSQAANLHPSLCKGKWTEP